MEQRRKQTRLKGYDYSNSNDYFVTICTHKRRCLLGDIINDKMALNEYGRIVINCWNGLIKHYPNTYLDEFTVMPNHIHGIITIIDICRGGVTPPLRYKPTLGQIVGYFKYQSTKKINETSNTPGNPVWQRSFYDHIIRNEKSPERIRDYIISNPGMWPRDQNNPISSQGNHNVR